MTPSDVSDLIALADTARGPVGSQADVRDGERVIAYAQWESQEHDRAMLDSPEARGPHGPRGDNRDRRTAATVPGRRPGRRRG
ncbi:hypothetical protein [Streptomyces sp. NPDC091219]|uniref:hypothetical protein n=1 Tax=Streptomyces sp. NPDC091219 TaxID=3155193 RepID=UPI00344F057D